MAARAHRHHVEEEESYFISMTDLMVGLLFIFIIMLMFFALQFKDAREQTVDHLRSAEEVRRQILSDIEQLLKEQGIEVKVVWDQGMLRLPESVLFEKGSAELNAQGRRSIEALASALMEVLPCYTSGELSRTEGCPARIATVDAIFIEGHTDNDPLTPRSGMRDNLDLSVMRATNTYRALLDASTDDAGVVAVLMFENSRDVPVLSVSGYGEYRPVEADQDTEELKAKNRRIDLRILMTTPQSKDVEVIQDNLNDAQRELSQ